MTNPTCTSIPGLGLDLIEQGKSELLGNPKHIPPDIKFAEYDSIRAFKEWLFSCGPAAICGVLGLTPDQVRPHMGDFESKGYTNPTLMYAALRSLGVSWRATVDAAGERRIAFPSFGLARIQWSGPWTKPGVPMAARYRKTHWVGSWKGDAGQCVFDVNAVCIGGWISFSQWSNKLVPWLIRECVSGGDGFWWVTHALEVDRG